ncbi:MAG TPA: trypsin-like peptidase domain-containing protein [Candidatus Angelobacter sp.]
MAENIWALLSNQLAEAAATVGKSVVAVHGRRHPSSGILWSGDAVVTASHALRRDDDISVVTGPGTNTQARLAGRDPSTDLAVLRLEQPVQGTAARWEDTSKLRVGELVLALGRTWRGNIVASSGVVSGLMGPWRTWRGGELDHFIRPDLTLYPGFSGGPLVNAEGEILGLNTAGLHRSGIAVPAATVARVAAELLEKGRIERPWLGVAMQSVGVPESLRTRLNLIASEGLLIVHVEPGSPAEKAGMLLGDLLLEIDGKPVAETDAVLEALRSHKPGSSAELKLARGGSLVKTTVTLAARP